MSLSLWPNQCLRVNSSRADGEWKPQLAGVSQKRPTTDVEPITPFDVGCLARESFRSWKVRLYQPMKNNYISLL